MTILGLVASPRGAGSQTRRLVDAVLEGARAAGAKTDCVDVCALRIQYCTACGVCFAKGHCVHRDDFAALYARILASEGLVWGSPNYFRSVSAQMKTLIDRMADAVHCQLLTGKYGVAAAAAGGPAHAETTDYLRQILIGFGADVVGTVGGAAAIPGSMDAAVAAGRALGGDLVAAIRETRAFPEQAAVHREMRTRFRDLVMRNKDAWPHEYEHWLSLETKA